MGSPPTRGPVNRLEPQARPRISISAALLAVVFTAFGCERKPLTLEQRGARAFSRTCAGCHGQDGRGATRPGWPVAPRDLTDSSVSELSDARIVEVIRNGSGKMPPFGKMIPREEVDAIVAHVRTLHSDPSVHKRDITKAP
jgi:mono/diheme cytochrome c family protein